MDENNLLQIYLKKSPLMNNQNIWIYILIFLSLSHSIYISSSLFFSKGKFEILYMKTNLTNRERKHTFTDTNYITKTESESVDTRVL